MKMKDLCPKGERPRVTYGSMVLEALKKTTLFHLRFNQEYKSLLPPLSAAESEALKRSIEQDGLHYPIIVSKDGTVLDGHNRLRACQELGIEPRFENAFF